MVPATRRLFVAHSPESGFELLARWAGRGGAAIKRSLTRSLGEALAQDGRTR